MAEVDIINIPDAASVVQTVATMSKALKAIGAPTDAADTHTDATSLTHTQILKQVSASGQSAATSLAAIVADTSPVRVSGFTITQPASSTIQRPADTNVYASGDLLANSIVAGSVVVLQFATLARISGGSGLIVGAQLQKSTNVVTNAAFRLHLFTAAPTFSGGGDNSPISTVVVASGKGYLGYIDISTMVGFFDVSWGSGAPDNARGAIPYVATAQIIYGVPELRGAYGPGSAEVFAFTLDALQD